MKNRKENPGRNHQDGEDLLEEMEKKKYMHYSPIHTQVSLSVLSKGSRNVSFRGFMNLAILLLIVNNIRLILENYLKYGFLLTSPFTTCQTTDWHYFFFTFLTSNIAPLNALLIEKQLLKSIQMKESLSYRFFHLLNILNILLSISFPTFFVYYFIDHAILGIILMFINVSGFFKLISFSLVNNDLRKELLEKKDSSRSELNFYEINYPNNLTLGNVFYFWVAPTLCYQLNYPRNNHFRWGYFFKRIFEFSFCMILIYFLGEQYARPTLDNSLQAVHDLNTLQIFERIMKFSTINVLIWLLGFYAFFHSYLNAASEVLRFGDRLFYLPWWNSTTLGQYWRLWNLPVHYWFKRHVYLPCVNRGIPSSLAIGVTFLISAIFHEVLIGIPTKAVKGYAFFGMLLQGPMMLFTQWVTSNRGRDSSLGNIIFWLSFCIIGQPLMVFSYYYEWYKLQH